jgi:SecD/SecF fusion protein
MAKGATLRMAIRNGFSRATSAIVDSNLTTFITAVVLYVIGTDQIRGFAVTLALGILMCMYTAVFCSRVVFELPSGSAGSRRSAWRTLIGATNIDFLKYRSRPPCFPPWSF